MAYEDNDFSSSIPDPRSSDGTLIDPRQLAALVIAARAAQQIRQAAALARSAALPQSSDPGQPSTGAAPASALGPTDPFAAGGGTTPPQVATAPRQPNQALAETIKSLRDPKPLQALDALVRAPAQMPTGVAPDGSLVRAVLGNTPSRIPRPAADVKPDFRVGAPDQRQVQATLNELMRGIGGPGNAPLGVLPDGSLVRGVLVNTPSRIPRSEAEPEANANLKVNDPKQARAALGGLLRGIGGPENPPLGVLPDGSLVRDVRYLTKAPSRIPKQYASGDYYSNINTDWIVKREGGSLVKGYVPQTGSDKSGVTVGAGFDLGQHSMADLRGLNLPASLVNKLSPYLGLTGQDARDALTKQPLTITRSEADQIDGVVVPKKLNDAAQAFDLEKVHNKTGGSGSFSLLPWQAQTVIADLWYNMGYLPDPKGAPVFWKQVTTGDWEGAYRNLMNFSSADPVLSARAKRDATLLREALDHGTLPAP